MRRQVSVPRRRASPSHAVCSGPCVGPAQGEPQVPKPRSVRGRPPHPWLLLRPRPHVPPLALAVPLDATSYRKSRGVCHFPFRGHKIVTRRR